MTQRYCDVTRTSCNTNCRVYIEALHVKTLHFKANYMDFFLNKRPFRETYDIAFTCSTASGRERRKFLCAKHRILVLCLVFTLFL